MTKPVVAAAACLSVVVASVPVLRAEEPEDLAVGKRVRVTTVAREAMAGTIEDLSAETISLRLAAGQPAIPVPRAEVTRLQLSKGRATGKGALIGAAIGAAPGLAIALACTKTGDDCDPLLAGLLIGGAGAAIGAAAGAILGSRERWQEVPSHRVRVGVAPILGRKTGVALSVSF